MWLLRFFFTLDFFFQAGEFIFRADDKDGEKGTVLKCRHLVSAVIATSSRKHAHELDMATADMTFSCLLSLFLYVKPVADSVGVVFLFLLNPYNI